MRLLAALLLLSFAVPVASASAGPPVTSPVGLYLDPGATTPSDECPDCVGVDLGAGVFLTNCYDCPAAGVRVGLLHGDGATTVQARACYGAFVVICLVDDEVTV